MLAPARVDETGFIGETSNVDATQRWTSPIESRPFRAAVSGMSFGMQTRYLRVGVYGMARIHERAVSHARNEPTLANFPSTSADRNFKRRAVSTARRRLSSTIDSSSIRSEDRGSEILNGRTSNIRSNATGRPDNIRKRYLGPSVTRVSESLMEATINVNEWKRPDSREIIEMF